MNPLEAYHSGIACRGGGTDSPNDDIIRGMLHRNLKTSRREFLGSAAVGAALFSAACAAPPPRRPNILFCISDDQSYPHASAYGCKFVNTPHFDRVANEGALFNNAVSASPGCSPARAALLTGLHDWQVEQAGTEQPATSLESKSEGRDKPQPESEGRSR